MKMDLAQFDPLVNVNYIPTDDEVLQIQSFLTEPLRKLQVIEGGISTAELQVRNMIQERADLLQQIDKYRTLMSPVRRLPPDVLQEIFIACLPKDRNPTMSCDEAPVILTRVCASWRSTAMNTPYLWTSLHIPVPRPSNTLYDLTSGEQISSTQVMNRRLSAVRAWIKRSGSLPLSFSLHEHDVYPPCDYAGVFLRCISEHRMRWKSISLVCAATSFAKIRDIPPSEIPLLETLSLLLSRTDKSNFKEIVEWKESPIFFAPRIRSVSLCSLDSTIFDFPFRWSQLTHFRTQSDPWNSFAETSIDDLTSILAHCQNLISCDLRLGHGSNPHRRTVFPLISLPRLESLKIYDGGEVTAFFSFLLAPNLHTLEYVAILSSTDATGSSALYCLLSAVGKTLQTLAITQVALQSDDAAEMPRLCPSLQSLSILSSIYPIPSRLDTKPPTITTAFLKMLENIPTLERFECHTEAHFSEKALVELILRKQSGGDTQLKPLKSIYVVFRRRTEIDIRSLLPPQILEGLKLEIQYPPRAYRGPFSLYDGLPPAETLDPYFYYQSQF